jgi:hypothetical protein
LRIIALSLAGSALSHFPDFAGASVLSLSKGAREGSFDSSGCLRPLSAENDNAPG